MFRSKLEGETTPKPQTTRRVAGSWDDQQPASGQVKPAMGVESTNHCLVDSVSFRPHKNVLNFHQTMLSGDQKLSIQIDWRTKSTATEEKRAGNMQGRAETMRETKLEKEKQRWKQGKSHTGKRAVRFSSQNPATKVGPD